MILITYSKNIFFIAFLVSITLVHTAFAQQQKKGIGVTKPIYIDPVYDGAADPVVIWNQLEKKWFMFYTNRRAKTEDSLGVRWVHGTRIGIAESTDGGATWKYRDTANINYRPVLEYTHWAPEIIADNGIYHMYLTYVPGIFNDWNHPRNIIHLTSANLLDWTYQSTLPLANDKVIDPCVFKLPNGNWRMWYNNEKAGKSIFYADSKDLYHWTDQGKAVNARGEGPKVFQWKGLYWMIIDVWKGLEIYSSTDLLSWKKQEERILEEPGKDIQDRAIGGHCDVLVNNGHAYIFYFTHPGRNKENPAPASSYLNRRSYIKFAELTYLNGAIGCNRDMPVDIHLQ